MSVTIDLADTVMRLGPLKDAVDGLRKARAGDGVDKEVRRVTGPGLAAGGRGEQMGSPAAVTPVRPTTPRRKTRCPSRRKAPSW